MHPEYRRRLLNLLAATDQCCTDLEKLSPEEKQISESANALRRELLNTRERIEVKLVAFGYKCNNCFDTGYVPCDWCGGQRQVYNWQTGQLDPCGRCNATGQQRCPSLH
jgi:hypothetical protein